MKAPGDPYILDLRDHTTNAIQGDAPHRLLAIMLYPRNQRARNKLMRDLALLGSENLREGAEALILDQVFRACTRPAIAGAMLLNLVRLEGAGYRPSLRMASRLTNEMWKWPNNLNDRRRFHGLGGGKHMPRHFQFWKEFRLVAHFWGAWLLAPTVDPRALPDFAPDFLKGPDETAEFANVAGYLACRGARIFLHGTDQNPRGARLRGPAIDPTKSWRCHLPTSYKPAPDWRPRIPPLTKAEVTIMKIRYAIASR